MSVIVAYSASAPGEAAVEAGIEEALRRSTPLRIVHVSRVGVRQETYASMRGHTDAIEAHAERARERGVEVVVTEEVRSTHAIAEALIDYAAEHDAAVLVVGVRRRSPVGKAVLGSVAQDLMLRAECPVLGVKGADGW
jgi:nucleotide-binding universal stress UspA family protein